MENQGNGESPNHSIPTTAAAVAVVDQVMAALEATMTDLTGLNHVLHLNSFSFPLVKVMLRIHWIIKSQIRITK